MKKTVKTSEKIKEARDMGGFMSGVLVLSVSTVIVKIIGLGVKIPLLSVLSAEGMGYFNSAVEIYALLCVVATAGLPVAMSMIISAERERGNLLGVRQAYKSAMRFFIALGLVGSGAMLFLARPIADAVGNPDAYFCIAAISPSLLFVCVSSAVRGYFQGFGYMTPTAVSQLLEALCKLIFGVWLGAFAIKLGMPLPMAAGMSVLGLSIGMLASSAYLLVKKGKDTKARERELCASSEPQKMGSRLLLIAFPITLSAAVIGSCRLVDMTLILRRLQSSGVAIERANIIYGSYATLALPVFGLIPSLVAPISLSVVPALCSAIEESNGKSQKRVVSKALRLTVLLSMPASMGVCFYARPILSILFSGESEAVGIAAPLLAVLGASVLFSSLITVTNAILQSYKKTVIPIISMAIGTAVKIILAYILIGIKEIGAYGAPISTLACDLTVTLINISIIEKCTPFCNETAKVFIKTLAASVCAMAVSVATYVSLLNLLGLSSKASFAVVLPITVFAYIVFAFVFGAVSKEDIDEFGIGKKLFKRDTAKAELSRDNYINIKREENQNDGRGKNIGPS